MSKKIQIPQEYIKSKILFVGEKKVMLDRDLAELYGVETRVLNQTVRRNFKRFPKDFMFQLNKKEKTELITICDNLKTLKFAPAKPYVFTEQGVTMLSCVLSSPRAIHVNIQIIRAFSKLREMLTEHKQLKKKIEEMEKKYDYQFKIVFDAIKRLFEPPVKSNKSIGFHSK